ncbi:cation diffusion facilitator family transporter [Streptomyces monticola]|uniref:Cation diffusion facilitator family transporter n=1 Tax=Streptomyces monticola TaxID=2666263 RepID=A0ABW2JJB3_9ACTN
MASDVQAPGGPETPEGPGEPGEPAAHASESTFTVIVAASANLGIAAAKAVAGVISGSSAMLSEAAHSVADTVTELMLLVSLKSGERPADEDHPLGYGGARYLWALLAAVATFVGGGVFAVYDGIHTLTHGEEPGDPLVAYVVLAIAFLLEGFSLRTGLKQARGEAARFGVHFKHYLRHTPDTAVKAVVLEDTAALAGLLLAAGGLLGGQLTGSGVWDGIASLCIGVLLVYVAWVLGRSNAELLIGKPMPRHMRNEVRALLLAEPQVEGVLELTTLVQGPSEVLVAAKVDFRDMSSAAEIEWACDRLERRLRERFPAIRRVYLDPTPGTQAAGGSPAASSR